MMISTSISKLQIKVCNLIGFGNNKDSHHLSLLDMDVADFLFSASAFYENEASSGPSVQGTSFIRRKRAHLYEFEYEPCVLHKPWAFFVMLIRALCALCKAGLT